MTVECRGLPIPIDDFAVGYFPREAASLPRLSLPAGVKFWVTLGPQYRHGYVANELLRMPQVCGARINASKFLDVEHLSSFILALGAAKGRNSNLEICLDLNGPKRRVVQLELFNGSATIEVRSGDRVLLGTCNDLSAVARRKDDVVVPISDEIGILSAGSVIFISDGWAQLRVEGREGGCFWCRALNDTPIPNGRGVDVFGLYDRLDPIVAADLRLLKLLRPALNSLDAICLSFTRSHDDLEKFRVLLESELGWTGKIVAKIETLGGVANALQIAQSADQVLIGRGDLAVQAAVVNRDMLTIEETVHSACCRAAKECIIGTRVADSLGDGRDALDQHEQYRLFRELQFARPLVLMLAHETSDPARAMQNVMRLADCIAVLNAGAAAATASAN